MKIFNLIKLGYENFTNTVQDHLGRALSTFGMTFGPNTIFGQLLSITGSVVQNMLLYVEDAMTEQNKYTAERKKSVYSLAQLSGYNPSLGKAAGCNIKLTFLPTANESLNVVLPNKTKLACANNGLTYNVILPQETIVLNVSKDNSSKYLYLVEGNFETQTFTVAGGQLWTQNVAFAGDCDIDYLEVRVNDEPWERCESLYDMKPDGKQYVCRTALTKGVDLVFGNNQYGRALANGDTVRVTYLIHSGELGNLSDQETAIFTFLEPLQTIGGDEINANEIFTVTNVSAHGVNGGTYGESKEQVREMIGYNSRALVLADSRNYEMFINKFSFCGYNRTWCEEGSLIVNSIIMKNFKNNLRDGLDYFALTEDDFFLSDAQKDSIISAIEQSGQQLAGTTFNIFDPELCKYAAYVYAKMKQVPYDKEFIENKIRMLVGEFFGNIQSDIYVPKSDLMHLLKQEIPEIDGVNVYFISERNEKAILDRYYTSNEYYYNPITKMYTTQKKVVRLYEGEDPGLGLDEHGNIYLDNNDQFPVLMGDWEFAPDSQDRSVKVRAEALTVVFQ